MKSITVSLFLLALVLVSVPRQSLAQPSPNPPGQISYQGYLTDANGFPLATNNPVNYNVIFRVYNASSAGSLLWAELQVVTIDRGYFTVLLGNGSSVPGAPSTNNLSGLFSGSDASDRYLELTVQGLAAGDPPIVPRLRLLSSPYSYLASKALSVDGAALTTGTVPDARLSSNVALRNGGNAFSGNQTINSGNLGIGTASPLDNLQIGDYSSGNIFMSMKTGGGNLWQAGIKLRHFNDTDGFDIIDNEATPNGLSFIRHPFGGTAATAMFVDRYSGAVGINTTTPGYTLDLNGSFHASGGANIAGGATITGGLNASAGYTTFNTTPDNTSGNMGVGGTVYSNVKLTISSSQGFGLYCSDTASGGTAAYFVGNVGITGTLSKGAGSFKIDHPLEPEKKWLYHSFVESPDMMNIYNGNAVTDSAGEATVTLPAYFEALNRDFRYQLTVVGQFAQAIIGREVSNNTFVIKTDKPNVKVSWQVTGIRHDAFANAHRITPEVAKTKEELGKYIHPEEHGQPESKGLKLVNVPVEN